MTFLFYVEISAQESEQPESHVDAAADATAAATTTAPADDDGHRQAQ